MRGKEMSKWVVDIHGDIEGDYEIIKKYEEPKTDVLDKIRAEIEEHAKINQNLNTDRARALCWCLDIIDKYKAESEE
jgi:hypothetical protein